MKAETNLMEQAGYQDLASRIEGEMNLLLDDSGSIQPILTYLVSTRGKRLRPLLVMWSTEACAETMTSSPNEDAVLEVAAAFELVHLASLVHDDIIDGAMERRGRPAAHVIWGNHSAILAGDYLFTRANRVALRYAGIGIASLINQAIELTCEGEIAQDSRLFELELTEREYLSHICKKTASLVGAACQAGAILGGGNGDMEEAMLRFGVELGCAFQITDDIIDLVSPVHTSGKPPCNDLKRGVLTLPLILAQRSTARDTLRKAFLQRTVSEPDIETIKEACLREGCIERARESARLLAKSAESRLSVLSPSKARTSLQSAARSVSDRLF